MIADAPKLSKYSPVKSNYNQASYKSSENFLNVTLPTVDDTNSWETSAAGSSKDPVDE